MFEMLENNIDRVLNYQHRSIYREEKSYFSTIKKLYFMSIFDIYN